MAAKQDFLPSSSTQPPKYRKNYAITHWILDTVPYTLYNACIRSMNCAAYTVQSGTVHCKVHLHSPLTCKGQVYCTMYSACIRCTKSVHCTVHVYCTIHALYSTCIQSLQCTMHVYITVTLQWIFTVRVLYSACKKIFVVSRGTPEASRAETLVKQNTDIQQERKRADQKGN